MNHSSVFVKLKYLILATRPKFLTAAAVPVITGSALGFVQAGNFSPVFFLLALCSVISLHAGANVANDYFDHLSGNDWANRNLSHFSGGRRFIQKGILSPKATLLISLFYFTLGALLGLVIIILTQDLFLLALGLVGLAGGFFYTAPPVKLVYRGIGEPVIALLFGLLPVYGSYYLQTGTVDFLPLLPAMIVSLHIFLVILVNEFPDLQADKAANKKTLAVTAGLGVSIWIFRFAIVACFVLAAVMLFFDKLFYAGLFYFLLLPLSIMAVKTADAKKLSGANYFTPNKIIILMHVISPVLLIIGFLIRL